jgi:hypothetical protein
MPIVAYVGVNTNTIMPSEVIPKVQISTGFLPNLSP